MRSTKDASGALRRVVAFLFLIVVNPVVIVIFERSEGLPDVVADDLGVRRVRGIDRGPGRILEPARDVHVDREVGRAGIRRDGGLEGRSISASASKVNVNGWS